MGNRHPSIRAGSVSENPIDWGLKEQVTVVKYTVVLEREADGGFVVSVPVLPGCVSQGDSRPEALAKHP